MNTLPQKVASKAVKVEQTETAERDEPAQRVNLNEARAWLIDPKQMGTLFKALALTPQDAPSPPGF